MWFRPGSAAVQGQRRSCVSDCLASRGRETDLLAGDQPAQSDRAVFVAGPRQRTRLGCAGCGTGAVREHLRPVPLRRLQGSELGLEDVRLRQGRGARRSPGKSHHERDQPRHDRHSSHAAGSCSSTTDGATPRFQRSTQSSTTRASSRISAERARRPTTSGCSWRPGWVTAAVEKARACSTRLARSSSGLNTARLLRCWSRPTSPVGRSIARARSVHIRRSRSTKGPAASTMWRALCALRRRANEGLQFPAFRRRYIPR